MQCFYHEQAALQPAIKQMMIIGRNVLNSTIMTSELEFKPIIVLWEKGYEECDPFINDSDAVPIRPLHLFLLK